jgi:uncharacterized protein YceH (UPF0502 family)
MAIVLQPIELRVLGVLIEKSMATPAYFPMTLHAVAAACNQRNNRDPVMSCAEGDVAAALHSLQRWQLASQAPPDRNSRANRFCHEVEKRFGWNTPQRAIMAELMLRGPQTPGELRTNASRLTRLEHLDYVREVLAELQAADPPMVVELPRRPGQSSTRFAQLLGGPPGEGVPSAAPAAAPAMPMAPAPPSTGGPSPAALADLRGELDALRAELHELRDRLRDAGILP